MLLSVLCAGCAMEFGIEAAAVGVWTVGGLAEDMDYRPSLAIDDGETCGPFLALTRLFRQFHGILFVVCCRVICGAVLSDSVIMACRFDRVFAKEYS